MIRLVVDANVLVGELLRAQGIAFLRDPRIELLCCDRVRNEAEHELRRRAAAMLRHGRLTPEAEPGLLAMAQRELEESVSSVPFAVYGTAEPIARLRIPRDPDDWPTVAAALVSDAAIWTNDGDFLGCAVPVWTSETLRLELERVPR